MSTLRRRAAVIAVSAITVTGVAGGAYAVGATTKPPIKACAAKTSGALRVLAKGSCKKTEKPVTWSVAGPVGKTGKTGPAGPQGGPGPSGPIGQTGPTGPSDAWSDGNNNGVALRGANGVSQGYVTVDSLTLPAGSYLITSSVLVYAIGTAAVMSCTLFLPGMQSNPLVTAAAGVYSGQMITNQAAPTFTAPTLVSLKCSATAGSGTDSAYATNGHLQAIKVGTLHSTGSI